MSDYTALVARLEAAADLLDLGGVPGGVGRKELAAMFREAIAALAPPSDRAAAITNSGGTVTNSGRDYEQQRTYTSTADRAAAVLAPRDMASDWPPEVVQKHVERLTGLLADDIDAAAAPAPEGVDKPWSDALEAHAREMERQVIALTAERDALRIRPVLSDEVLRELAAAHMDQDIVGPAGEQPWGRDSDIRWLVAFARAVLARQQFET